MTDGRGPLKRGFKTTKPKKNCAIQNKSIIIILAISDSFECGAQTHPQPI